MILELRTVFGTIPGFQINEPIYYPQGALFFYRETHEGRYLNATNYRSDQLIHTIAIIALDYPHGLAFNFGRVN